MEGSAGGKKMGIEGCRYFLSNDLKYMMFIVIGNKKEEGGVDGSDGGVNVRIEEKDIGGEEHGIRNRGCERKGDMNAGEMVLE